MRQPASTGDPLWYKDAIIYEVHVRSFFDSNNDGTGDFPGLTAKLDYLQALGITCLWLLPFYPSPLRDDGYDIARYDDVHAAYGSLRDFRHFLREAHARHIQVITELVVNHTSDQHPWFQAARRAAPGSSKRDFYVWSDTNRRYQDARVIFTDTERSNWTWDNEAEAYYWHRFFHHQPDLNYDNPRVRRAIMRVLRFWLDMGVDGLRLDAVPYLIEREGTNCENLDETHEILKEMRREVDAGYAHRMLLAEANQWPADVRAYMGEGDECHMAFHFPLMPRIFMALQQEDRHPITEILDQTPEIPDNCQWALFLRNHDELTLEMVTDEERDYMYSAYAADPQMRLNVGIRRRLAPLMENSRRRIELMNTLLFSLPGTPIIYYGDEIGMGDNIYLGDRNGVRTPMQWTGDRNAGFSKADPARLYAPPIMDPVYGYQGLNVEAQERSPYSLLNWMKRMIGLRRQHRIFGRGSIRFLPLRNRRVLAYLRSHGDNQVLVVANLARTVQPAEIALSACRGLVPVEMIGGTEFPRIGELPYFVTLGPYSSYWFQLLHEPPAMTARVLEAPPEAAPERLPALLAGGAWERLLEGNIRRLIDRDYLVPYLTRQRWFAAVDAGPSARIVDWGLLRTGPEPAFLTIVEVQHPRGGRVVYAVPVALAAEANADAMAREHPEAIIARVKGARRGLLYDGTADPSLARVLLGAIDSSREIRMRGGRLRAFQTSPWAVARPPDPASLPVRRGGFDQSNSSLVFGDMLILKLFRRLEAGRNPDLELTLHLGANGFTRVPPVYGGFEYADADGRPHDLGVLQGFVESQASGWDFAVEELRRFLERTTGQGAPGPDLRPDLGTFLAPAPPVVPAEVRDMIGWYLDLCAMLGTRTGEMHLASASGADAAFLPEPTGREALERLRHDMVHEAAVSLDGLLQAHDRLPAADAGRAEVALAARPRILSVFDRLLRLGDTGLRIRVHGDFHLGQVLQVEGDFVFLDFEGEPARTLSERRSRHFALKDVAGMIRSFSYAAGATVRAARGAAAADRDRFDEWAGIWQAWCAGTFLHAYSRTTAGRGLTPADPSDALSMLRVLMLEKALYELRYEMAHRPDWIGIPLSGVLEVVEGEGAP